MAMRSVKERQAPSRLPLASVIATIAARMPAPLYLNGAYGGAIVDIANPGVRVAGEQLYHMRDDVARMLNRKQSSFPGAQPVSFTREHLERDLMAKDYFVCEKSDGLRYLLYLTSDADGCEMVYFIDRKNDYWHIPTRHLHFPRPNDSNAFHTSTILDGELVIDHPPGDGAPQAKFLAFDCLIVDGQPLMHKEFHKRLGFLQEMVIKPFKRFLAEDSDDPDRAGRMPFTLELKHLEFSYGVDSVFRQIESGLLHKNDGLIFTDRCSTYKFGTDPDILKWKPAHENSIDCRLRLRPRQVTGEDGFLRPDYSAVPQAEIWTFTGKARGKAQYRKFTDLTFADGEWETLVASRDPLHNRIVECYRNEEGHWRISRFRDDKPEANHHTVLDKVLQSIEDGVEQKDLVDAAAKMRSAWKSRHAGGEGDERKRLEEERKKSDGDKEEKRDQRLLVQGQKRPVEKMSSAEGKDDAEEEGNKRMRPHA